MILHLIKKQLHNLTLIFGSLLLTSYSSYSQIRVFQMGGVGFYSEDSIQILKKEKVFSYDILLKGYNTKAFDLKDKIDSLGKSITLSKGESIMNISKIQVDNDIYYVYYIPLINLNGDIKPYSKAIIIGNNVKKTKTVDYYANNSYTFFDYNKDKLLDMLLFNEVNNRVYLYINKKGKFIKTQKYIQLSELIDEKGRRINFEKSKWDRPLKSLW